MSGILFADPAPGTPIPSTLAGLVAIFRTITSVDTGTAGGTSGGVFIQAAVPTTAQQGNVWLRVGDGGEPLATYIFFTGRWCKVWGVPVGTIWFLRTDPTQLFNNTTGLGLFDSGTPGLAGDFYGWKLRLKSDTSGTQAINRFVIAADDWNTTTHNFTATKPDGTVSHKGDASGLAINANQVPSLAITGREYNAGATDTVARVVVSTHTSGADVNSDPTQSGAINGGQANFVSLPPFVAFGMIEYIGPIYTDPTVQQDI